MYYEKLKTARKKAGYSQEQVADIINTSRSNISKYETGALEPNLETLKKLCELYNVSANYILDINIKIPNEEEQKANDKERA